MAITALLTLSYLLKYRRGAFGLGLAYCRLIYAALSIGFLAIRLFQSHAGCPDLTGGCYYPARPGRIRGFKATWGYLLVGTNVFAVMTVGRTLKSLFMQSTP